MLSIKNNFVLTKEIDSIIFANRVCVNPMEGSDANSDGTPGELTKRRYLSFAAGGAGLIWFEAVAVAKEFRASPNQLIISEENLHTFADLVSRIKTINPNVKLICQLTHSGRFSRPEGVPNALSVMRDPFLDKRYPEHTSFPIVTDEYLSALPRRFAAAAALCKRAGFDGVDIKACHRYLVSELLAAHTRVGRYGGTLENRSRLIDEIFQEISPLASGGFLLCSRFGVYDAIPYPFGFGVDRENGGVDLSEPIAVLKKLQSRGLSLVNVTMGTPYFNSHVNKPHKSEFCDPEHSISNLIEGARQIKRACEGLSVVSTGLSYSKEKAFIRGNAMLTAGDADFIGFGRLAFANKNFAFELLNGALDASKCCIACNKCSELLRAGLPSGCVVRDSEVYVPIYRKLVKQRKSAAADAVKGGLTYK